MADTKISAGADPGTLTATDKLPLARSASTTAYAATVAEIAAFANGAYTPNYATATPTMDGTGAAGTASTVSRGDHKHPTDTTLLSRGGGTMTGTLVLAADPAAPLQAATKQYVDGSAPVGGPYVAIANMHDVGRNLIHNPLFNVAQRGAGPWTTGYTLDRWSLAVSSDTSTVAVASASDAIRAAIGDEAVASLLSLGVNGNAAAAAFTFVSQKIEGVRRLSGKTVTASFWASASGATKLGVNMMQDFGTGGSPSAAIWLTAVPLTLSPTWTRYSATFVIPSSTGKTLGTANNDETTLALWASSGTSNAAIAGTPGVQTGTINIWGVQLEVGSVATPLEKPDPQQDLAKCQRFYQVGNVQVLNYVGAALGNTSTMLGLPVTMRAAPTVVPTWTTTTNTTSPGISVTSASALLPNVQATAAGVVNLIGSFTASADL